MTDDWFEPVRARLIARRQLLGLTRSDVARRADIHHSQVVRCESRRPRHPGGLVIPGPISLCRWAGALRIEASLILTLSAAEWPEPFVLDVSDAHRF